MLQSVTPLRRGTGGTPCGDGPAIGLRIGILAAAALIVGLAVRAEAQLPGENPPPAGPAQEKRQELRRGEAGPRDHAPKESRTSIALPKVSGWAMRADGVTLLIALPEKAQLATIDTLAEEELPRVDLPFKPDLLAGQGKSLFASVRGGNAIHVLDVGTSTGAGADRKEIHLPTGPATGLACHRERGPLFVSLPDPTMIGAVVAVDPKSGAIAYAGRAVPNSMDPAKVHSVALTADPANPQGFYCLVPWSSGRHTTPGLGLTRVGIRGTMAFRPYSGPPFKPPHHDPQAMPAGMVAVVGEFAILERVGKIGSPVHASSDGRQVGVIDYDGDGVAVLSARNVNERLGRMDCPSASDFAFHPVLGLAAAEGKGTGRDKGRTLYLFHCDSLAEFARFPLGHAAEDEPDPNERLLTFGGRGTKLVYYDSRKKRLRFFPLPLTEADQAALAKAYNLGHGHKE